MAVITSYLLNVVVLIIITPYIIGPLIVWYTQRLPEKYRFAKLDSEAFLSARSETFKALHHEIVEQGFAYIGSSELLSHNSSLNFSLYNESDLKLACTLVYAHSVPKKMTYIEFTQMYEDGCVLNVSNSSIASVYPKSPSRKSFRYPDVNDFTALLAIAKSLTTSVNSEKIKLGFVQGKEFESVESSLNREMQELIDKGWVSANTKADGRRLTAKGALLMTWKLCWPVKQLLNSRDITSARKVFKEGV